MGEWILHSEDKILPKWLSENISANCFYCNHPMMNYYNDDYRCTNRRCSNPNCSSMLAARADFMVKLIGLKGIGYKTCLDILRSGSYKHHVELLKHWGLKPTVTLHNYLRMHCFEGIDSEWEKICQKLGIYTLDELYDVYTGKLRYVLDANRELLYNNLQYVNLVERPSGNFQQRPAMYVTIMITGTPNGFDTKEDFINQINKSMLGKIVVLHQKTAKQSGVDFLIREPGSVTRGKLSAAKKGGIPVVTSEQFIDWLVARLLEMKPENKES